MEYPRHENTEPRWEKVTTSTERLSVPGGWLYKVTYNGDAVAMQFVPDPNYWGPTDQPVDKQFIQEIDVGGEPYV